MMDKYKTTFTRSTHGYENKKYFIDPGSVWVGELIMITAKHMFNRARIFILKLIFKDDGLMVNKYCFKDDVVVEFWLDGFNTDMFTAAFNITHLYINLLHKDSNWHFFFEDSYSLIRCSNKYAKLVRLFFEKRSIDYKYKGAWSESLYITNVYREEFKNIFHWNSVLAIKMFLEDDTVLSTIHAAADRIIHSYCNKMTFFADDYRKLFESGNDGNYWEANLMAGLAAGRSYHIGKIQGQKDMVYAQQKKKARAAESI